MCSCVSTCQRSIHGVVGLAGSHKLVHTNWNSAMNRWCSKQLARYHDVCSGGLKQAEEAFAESCAVLHELGTLFRLNCISRLSSFQWVNFPILKIILCCMYYSNRAYDYTGRFSLYAVVGVRSHVTAATFRGSYNSNTIAANTASRCYTTMQRLHPVVCPVSKSGFHSYDSNLIRP